MSRICLFLVLSCALLASCTTTGSSVVSAYVLATAPEGAPPGWIVFDGDVLVAKGHVGAEAAVVLKSTGIPVFGPEVTTPGKVLVYRRSTETRLELEVNEPLPFWTRSAFPLGLAERFGVTFK